MSIFGSNNLMLPLQRRVQQRLQELKEEGKVRNYKDELKNWHVVEPSKPVAGSLEYADCVSKLGDGRYLLRYQLYKTVKGKDGSPKVVEHLVGPSTSGLAMKVIEYLVTETFEKGKQFRSKSEKFIDPRFANEDVVPEEEKPAAPGPATNVK